MSIAVRTDTGVPLEAKLTLTPASMGGVRMFSENDAGAKTLVPYLKSPETSADYRLRMGRDTPLFWDVFNSTAQNTNKWKCLFTTMTATMGSGSLLLNANSTAGATTGVLLQSWLHFAVDSGKTMYYEVVLQLTAAMLANQVCVFGPGVGATATAEPTDGVYLRRTSAGLFLVIKNNTAEVSVTPVAAALTPGENVKIVLLLNQREVEVWIDDVLQAEVECPDAQGMFALSGSWPVVLQQYNAGLVSGAPQAQVKVAHVNVSVADVETGLTSGEQAAASGQMAYQGQNGGTLTTTAQFANSANPSAAVPVNGSAALGSGLGGLFLHTNTLAVTPVDGIVCSFTNPAGGVNQTPRNLKIKGVKIETAVQTALANVAGAVYVFSLAYGGTTVDLSTAQSASFVNNTALAAKRIALGVQGAVGALVQGSVLKDINARFDGCPIILAPGQVVSVVVKNIGTVGTAGVLAHTITFDAAFE